MAVTSDDPTQVLPRIPRQAPPPPAERAPEPADEAAPDLVQADVGSPAEDASDSMVVAETVDPAAELIEVPPPPEPLNVPWLARVAWSVPAVIMAAVGSVGVWSAPLSTGELNTWRFAATPARDFWTLLGEAGGSQAPYLVLVRGFVAVAGTSDVAVRLPSLLAMTVAAALVAALGVRLAGLRVGLAAGVLFAALPPAARFGQDAGPDALALCAALAATLLLVRVLDEPRPRAYVWYSGTLALVGLFHVPALCGLVLAHAATVVAWRAPGRRAGAWLLTVVAAAVPVVPFAVLWVRDAAEPGALSGALSWAAARSMPADLLGGALLAGAVLALAFVGMSMRRRVVVATLLLVVTAVAAAVGSAFTPLWEPRYLLVAVPAVAVLAAVALRHFTLVRGLAVVLAVGLLGIPAQVEIRDTAGHGSASRAVGAALRAEMRPGDVAVYGPAGGPDQRAARVAVARYAGPARPADPLAAIEPGRNGGADVAECAGAAVASCLGQPDRVWVVRAGTFADPLDGLEGAKQDVLRAGYAPARVWRPAGYTVGLYRRATGAG